MEGLQDHWTDIEVSVMSRCKKCGTTNIELKKEGNREFLVCENGHFIGAVLARTIKDEKGKTRVYWPDTEEFM